MILLVKSGKPTNSPTNQPTNPLFLFWSTWKDIDFFIFAPLSPEIWQDSVEVPDPSFKLFKVAVYFFLCY